MNAGLLRGVRGCFMASGFLLALIGGLSSIQGEIAWRHLQWGATLMVSALVVQSMLKSDAEWNDDSDSLSSCFLSALGWLTAWRGCLNLLIGSGCSFFLENWSGWIWSGWLWAIVGVFVVRAGRFFKGNPNAS